MNRLIILSSLVIISACSTLAQSESVLKQFFEGRNVVVKIDMPATKDGVNVFPEEAQQVDYNEYGKRLKQFGVALRAGDSVMITKIKINGKHMEFQLGGGGYGTIGDESPAAITPTPVPKSRREKDLEEDLRQETDPDIRRQMKRDLDDLRRRREREERRNQAIADEATEVKRARIAEKSLQAGSRFNIHYKQKIDPSSLTPEEIVDVLQKYLDFSMEQGRGISSFRRIVYQAPKTRHVGPAVVRLGPSTTFLRNGLSRQEVVKLLGEPFSTVETMDGNAVVTTCVFHRSGDRILIAQFRDDVLIASRLQTSGVLAQTRLSS